MSKSERAIPIWVYGCFAVTCIAFVSSYVLEKYEDDQIVRQEYKFSPSEGGGSGMKIYNFEVE